ISRVLRTPASPAAQLVIQPDSVMGSAGPASTTRGPSARAGLPPPFAMIITTPARTSASAAATPILARLDNFDQALCELASSSLGPRSAGVSGAERGAFLETGESDAAAAFNVSGFAAAGGTAWIRGGSGLAGSGVGSAF